MFLVYKLKLLVAGRVDSVMLQVPRALAVSVLALAVDIAILEFCLRIVGMAAIPASVVGYLAGGVLQYVLCSVWVFSASMKNDARSRQRSSPPLAWRLPGTS